MSLVSDGLNSYIPQMSNQMAGSLVAGGGTLACYGYNKLSKANGFQEKLKAGGFIVAGLGFATAGVLGAISNAWQSVFPSNSPINYPDPHLQTCHAVLQGGIPAEKMEIYSAEVNELDRFIPSMQEGVHYSELTASMQQGYLYCWATLTELGKQLIGKDSLRVHTAGIPGTIYAKINLR